MSQRHMDTVAYRIGSQVNDHDARLRIIEKDLGILTDCNRTLKHRMNEHEKEQNAANMRLLLTVIGFIISATGGAVFMVFQLMTKTHP